MNKTAPLLLLSIVMTLFGQFTSSGMPSNSLIPANADSAILPIPGFATDSSSKDSAKLDTTTKKDTTLIPINKGFSFGVRWSFTSSNVFEDWATQQQSYMTQLSETIRERKSEPASVLWLIKPEKQSFSFPVSIGFFHRIDSLKSLSIHSHYAFRKQHSTFVALHDTTRAILHETDSKIIHHQAEIMAELQFRIPTTYFSVAGVDATGFTLLAGLIPLSYFALENNSTIVEMRRVGSTYGAGGSWGLGIFTDKQISNQFMSRFFFNYHGNSTYGYNNFASLFTVQPIAVPEQNQILTEHFFELGISGVVTRKKQI